MDGSCRERSSADGLARMAERLPVTWAMTNFKIPSRLTATGEARKMTTVPVPILLQNDW